MEVYEKDQLYKRSITHQDYLGNSDNIRNSGGSGLLSHHITEKVFHYGNSNMIEMDASKLGARFDPNFEIALTDTNKQVEKIIADKITHQRLYGKKSITAGGNHLLEIGDQVEDISKTEYKINAGNAKRYNEKAVKFLNSRGFTGVLTGLQVLNFSNAVLGVFSDSNNSEWDYIKAGTNAVGIAVELSEASLKLTQAHFLAIGKEASATALSKNIIRAGVIGGVITSGMCIWDGVIALNRRDADAGAAWIGAGVAFGVSTAAAVWGSSVAILAGPVGWIALGIGFGLVLLANVFTDSELEYYFKNFLLSDDKPFALAKGESPMEYNRRLYVARTTLVDYTDKDIRETLTNPSDAMASLFDLTVCNSIAYKALSFGPKKGHGHSGYRIIKSYEIRVDFNQFLKKGEQAEVVIVLLNDTDKTAGTPSVFYPKTSAKVEKLLNGQQQLVCTVGIPSELTKNSNYWYKAVIALRLHIDASINSYFPYPMENAQERYMATRLSLKKGMHGGGMGTKELKFDSLENLKKPTTW